MIPKLQSLAVLLFALIVAGSLHGQTPVVNYLQPTAVAPGATTEVTCFGDKLSDATVLWTSFAATAVLVPDKCDRTKAVFRVTVPSGSAAGVGAIRLATRTGLSALRFVLIDDMASINAAETNSIMASAQLIKMPLAVEGACRAEGYSYFKFEAGKGQRISLDVVARRLGSPLDPLIRVLDPAGRELAYLDDSPGQDGDCQLIFTAPSKGMYFVELRDTVYGGGPGHRYRLRMGRFPLAPWRFPELVSSDNRAPRLVLGEPNDTPEKSLKVALPAMVSGRFEKAKDQDWIEFGAAKGDRLVISGWSRALGSACDVALALFNADGKQLASSPAGEGDPITFTNTIAVEGTYRLRVQELNGLGGPGFFYRVEIAPQTPGFTIAADLDQLSVVEDSNAVIKVTCVRRDYDGSIQLRCDGLPTGYEVDTARIDDKKTEVELKLKVPVDAKPGTLLAFRLIGEAEVNGKKLEVRAGTMTALRRAFPDLLYPPEALDGSITLGIRSSDSNVDVVAPARKKKK